MVWVLLPIGLSVFIACGGGQSNSGNPKNVRLTPANVEVAPVPALPFPLLSIPHSSVESAPLDDELTEIESAKAYWLGKRGARDYIVEIKASQRSDNEKDTSGAEGPNPPPLVLVHGLGDAGMRDFYSVVSELSVGRDLLLIDLPGLARSEVAEDQPLTPVYFSKRVAAIIQSRIDGPFDLLGHSLGGNVCLTLAAHPQLPLRRLVIVDAAGVLNRYSFVNSLVDKAATSADRAHSSVGGLVRTMSTTLTELSNAMEPSEEKIARMGDTMGKPGSKAAIALILHRVGPYIAGIRAPTLLVWGKNDPIAPLRTGQLLADRIRNGKLVALDDVGHVPMKEATTRFLQHVKVFLEDNREDDFDTVERDTIKQEMIQDKRIDCGESTIGTYTGRFRNLHLVNCSDIVVEDAVIEKLIIEDSVVALIGVQVKNGLTVSGSKLFMTGGHIDGEVGLYLDDSTADIAGTLFSGTQYAIAAKSSSYLLLSVTFVQSPLNSGVIHDRIGLEADEAL